MKCDKCDGSGEITICIHCKREVPNSEQVFHINDYGAATEYGPYCKDCISKSDLIHAKESKTVVHSRDLTAPHNMDNLLDDLRTRPTEPPDPPKRGDFPNPRCEKKLQNGPDTYVQCDSHLGHKGNHSHQYNSDHRYTWEDNASA